MIRFIEYSASERKLKYLNCSNKKLHVRIDLYEGYTNSFMFSNYLELDTNPNIHYFTYIPGSWKNMRAFFYDLETNELIAPFVFDGNIDLREYDYENYLTNVQKQNTLGQQAGVNDVLREHFCDRQYENIVDVEEGDVVVDIGFNHGIFSLGAIMKKASKIYGFEPNKNIFEKLKDYPRKDIVKVFNLAVSDKNETLTFYEGDNTLGSSIYDSVVDYKESYQVQCVNFYDFIKSQGIEKIDFLKIDCEGTEYEVFESIPDVFFKTIKKIHVEFHFNTDFRIKSLIDKLERNEFDWEFEEGKDFNSDIGLIFAKKKEKNYYETFEKIKHIQPKNDFENFFLNKKGKKNIHKWFHYLEVYDRYFSKFRGKEICILEIGVENGGSLEMWKNYFGPKVKIYGVDINTNCKIYEEEQIEIFIGSQDDEEFLESLKTKIPKLDIIIDDGGHTMSQQIITYEHMIDHMTDDSIYICEDLHTSYWPKFYGGGLKKEGTFIEYSKNFIDYINAWHSKQQEIRYETKNIFGIHYYDSMLVLEKRKINEPFHSDNGIINEMR
jgi:FkbM family methyltransferase